MYAWTLCLTGLLCAAAFVTPAAAAFTAPGATGTLNICYFFLGGPDDLGWTFSYNLARLRTHDALVAEYPGATFNSWLYKDFHLVAPAAAFSAISGFIAAKQCHVVAHNSFFLFGSWAGESAVVDAFPNVMFVLLNTFRTGEWQRPNVLWFGYNTEPGYFIAGAAAAAQAKDCIAYITPYPSHYTGFGHGVRFINQTKKVHVILMGRWGWEGGEEDMADLFVGMGCDIVVSYSDRRAVNVHVPQVRPGAMTVGSHSDLQQYVGDTVLTSVYAKWEKLFLPQMRSLLINGTFENSTWPHMFGTKSGVVTTTEVSPLATPAARAAWQLAAAHVTANDDSIFCGNLTYVDGTAVPVETGTGCMSTLQVPTNFISSAHTTHYPLFTYKDACAAGSSYAYRTTATFIGAVCTNCTAGYYTPTLASPQCLMCDAGFTSGAAAANCSACPPGSFAAAAGSPLCGSCPAGTFASRNGSTVCDPCVEGFESAAGASVCRKSPAPADYTLLYSVVGVLGAALLAGGAAALLSWLNRRNRFAVTTASHCAVAVVSIQGYAQLCDNFPGKMPGVALKFAAAARRAAHAHGCHVATRAGQSYVMLVAANSEHALLCAHAVQKAAAKIDVNAVATDGDAAGSRIASGVSRNGSQCSRSQVASRRASRATEGSQVASRRASRATEGHSTSGVNSDGGGTVTSKVAQAKVCTSAALNWGLVDVAYIAEEDHYVYTGDAVTLAAEVVDIAKGGQALMTAAFDEALTEQEATVTARGVVGTLAFRDEKVAIFKYGAADGDADAVLVKTGDGADSVAMVVNNVEGKLGRRPVAMAVVRIGHHAPADAAVKGGGGDAAALTALYDELLDVVEQEAAACGGELQSACGGYFCVTFNARRTCGSRAQKAMRFAAALRAVVGDDKRFTHLRVTAGVAAGEAMAGERGRQLRLSGAVEVKASALQQRAAAMPPLVSCLVSGDLTADLAATMATWAYVGSIERRDPKTGQPVLGAPERVIALEHMPQDGANDDDEWMYTLDQNAAASPFAAANNAWQQLFDGRAEFAATCLADLSDPPADTLLALAVAELKAVVAVDRAITVSPPSAIDADEQHASLALPGHVAEE
jgi:basic membrane lipoprotein Med (substrate-binding protein (PBP1-ABC) superfamily)/class 3 adenylate cyclase